MRRFPLFAAALVLLAPTGAAAQQQPSDVRFGAFTQERVGADQVKLVGSVEIIHGDTRVHAAEAEFFEKDGRVVASGNVVLSQGENTIAAERADFNIRTRLGTFHHARGSASIRPQPATGSSGFAAPPTSEDTAVFFFGETIEKIGAKRYRITNGGFTTCVQPTPRWNLHANTVVLNVDDYTLLRNAVFKVKDVPLLYLPVLYYPTKEEQRATGFLLPTYSSSTLRGQSVSNSFFWAIDRSTDATFMHDWYSKTGHGYGGEYRYNRGGGADGSIRGYLLDERETTYLLPTGETTLPARRSFDLRGAANQVLPGNLRARAQVDYPSDIVTMQSFYTDVIDATRNRRSFGGNLVGSWGAYSLNANIDRAEVFWNQTDSVVYGNTPRVSITRSERPLFANAPVYLSMSGEYAGVERQTRSGGALINDAGIGRLDFAPQVSFPFKRWQWFTVNSTAAWRDTFYTRSYAGTGAPNPTEIVDASVNRRYFTLAARAVGPVFNRVWDTPDNGYAERFKHTVEPFLNISRTSSIDNYDRIVQTDGIDAVVGNAANYTYGVNNRFYAKRRIGQTSQAQEIVSASVSQSYYTDERSAQFDQQYGTSLGGAPSHFSPIHVNVNASPSQVFNAALRAEIDSRHRELRTLSVTSGYNWTGVVQTTVGWSRRFFIEDLPGFNDVRFLDHTLNVGTNVRTRDNRLGGVYSLSYDVRRAYFVNQSVQGFYNAQCCGIAMQYGESGYAPAGSSFPRNRTFFISFTLAGLGNFSPFSGGLGAIPR